MKNDSAHRLKYLRFMAFYSVIMLGIIFFLSLKKDDAPVSVLKETIVNEQTSSGLEYVYVHPQETSTDITTEEEVYTVKEYNGQIGIFSSDGSLVQTLDTNVKTLPEADKRLLQEGFEIIGRSQLNSIIEDYTE